MALIGIATVVPALEHIFNVKRSRLRAHPPRDRNGSRLRFHAGTQTLESDVGISVILSKIVAFFRLACIGIRLLQREDRTNGAGESLRRQGSSASANPRMPARTVPRRVSASCIISVLTVESSRPLNH